MSAQMSKVEFDRYYGFLEELHLLRLEGDLDQWAKVENEFNQAFPETENRVLDKQVVVEQVQPAESENWLQMLIEASEMEGYDVSFLKN